MAAHEFLFALELSDEPDFDRMLTELTGALFAHVGYSKAAVEELRQALHGALTGGLSCDERRCDIRFCAHAGELQIVVSYAGGGQWRTARPLPEER